MLNISNWKYFTFRYKKIPTSDNNIKINYIIINNENGVMKNIIVKNKIYSKKNQSYDNKKNIYQNQKMIFWKRIVLIYCLVFLFSLLYEGPLLYGHHIHQIYHYIHHHFHLNYLPNERRHFSSFDNFSNSINVMTLRIFIV